MMIKPYFHILEGYRKKPCFLVFFFLLILTCNGCRDLKNQPVSVIGSTSIQPFAELLAEEYQKTAPARNVDVQGGGSTAGIQALADGIADIGMCSRALNEEEKTRFTPIEIARDGLAVVVHKSNSVDNLTKQQIQMLFSGRIKNWKELGGRDMPVRLIMREEGSGTREAFINLVMKKDPVSRKAPAQLHHLRETFESIPYPLMEPQNELVGTGAFCLARQGDIYLVYLADVRETALNVGLTVQNCTVTWIDPRTGERTSSVDTAKGNITLHAPSSGDWAAIIQVEP